jgi:XRE family aerobic/anaerobic benzoate catabolism transcriptional regulator
MGLKFVELDAAIEAAAGLRLAEIFELHGEGYYRRLERETLMTLLAEPNGMVLATGGGLVTDRETYRLLKRRAVTVWLKARPEDHWNRVLLQGDQRPMAQHPHAMAELRALLAARQRLYADAEHVVDTSRMKVGEVVDALLRELGGAA